MIFLDAAGPVLFAVFGAFAFMLAILLAFALEAVVLRLLQWASLGRCFLDSLVMNAVSTALGILLVVVSSSLASGTDFAEGDATPLWGLLAAAFVVTVISEAVVLMISQRGSGWRAWRASLAANVTSYAVVAVLTVVLGRSL